MHGHDLFGPEGDEDRRIGRDRHPGGGRDGGREGVRAGEESSASDAWREMRLALRSFSLREAGEVKLDEVETSPLGRAVTGTTFGMFLPVFAIWLVSLTFAIPIAFIAGAVLQETSVVPWALVVFWTLGAGLMFLRPVEQQFGHLLLGVRSPTDEERTRLEAVWGQVCRRANVDPKGFILRVEDTGGLNASAAGGHIVAVTRSALSEPDDRLEAVLAHELGHHLDLHPVASLLTWWYMLPAVVGYYCIGLAMNVSAFMARAFTGWAALIALIVNLVIWLFRVYMSLLYRAAFFFSTVLCRSGEYAADRHATDLGYGSALLELFKSWVEEGRDDASVRGGLMTRAFASHPPLYKRVIAVEQRLASGSGSQAPTRA